MISKRSLKTALAVASLLVLPTLSATGCDSKGGGDGPTTTCKISYAGPEDTTKKAYGARCEADEECAWGVCMMPGDNGNETTDVFGFCTRGCDCEDDPASQLSVAEKESYLCRMTLTPYQHYRHIVMKCGSVSDCAGIDPGYNVCEATHGVLKYCQAK